MNNSKKINMSNKWQDYWIKHKSDIKIRKYYLLLFYQIQMFKILKNLINRELKTKNKVRIINFGSGVDYISLKLKKKFGDKLEVYLLDISQECLDLNKSLYAQNKVNAKFILADIFKPNINIKFDIIFNTGVLEHFYDNEKKKIFKNVFEISKNNGWFVTANPSIYGKLYMSGKNIAEKKNIWKFGREMPIISLKKFSSKNINLKYEYAVDSLSQLYFLKYYNLFFFSKIEFLYNIFKIPIIYNVTDKFFGHFLGNYLLVSFFEVKK